MGRGLEAVSVTPSLSELTTSTSASSSVSETDRVESRRSTNSPSPSRSPSMRTRAELPVAVHDEAGPVAAPGAQAGSEPQKRYGRFCCVSRPTNAMVKGRSGVLAGVVTACGTGSSGAVSCRDSTVRSARVARVTFSFGSPCRSTR